MDLSIYNIIKGPKITEKAAKMNQELKQLVLEVHPEANKKLIGEALKKLFNVKVEKIGIVVRQGKKRRVGKHVTFGKSRKKAIITLKEGYSVDLMSLGQNELPTKES